MALISRTESFGSGHFYYNNNNNYLDQSNNNNGLGLFYNNNNYMMIEKRQVFLRSYQFSRKKSLTERIKRSLVRVKRVIWLRLKSARRLRRLTCFRLRSGLSYRRRRFVRLINNKYCNNNNSYCFW